MELHTNQIQKVNVPDELMNITSKNTPILTSGLNSELHVENIGTLAENILEKYNEEIEDINTATCKVKGVM